MLIYFVLWKSSEPNCICIPLSCKCLASLSCKCIARLTLRFGRLNHFATLVEVEKTPFKTTHVTYFFSVPSYPNSILSQDTYFGELLLSWTKTHVLCSCLGSRLFRYLLASCSYEGGSAAEASPSVRLGVDWVWRIHADAAARLETPPPTMAMLLGWSGMLVVG